MPPIIGITGSFLPAQGDRIAQFAAAEAYVQAVARAGGLPVILPPAQPADALRSTDLLEIFSRLDGVLFTGGADIDPARFNGKPHAKVYGIDPQRDELEIQLVKLSAERGKPFLGICRGIQVINVALGGTLFTHIEDQLPKPLKHDYFPDWPRDHLAHSVSIEPRSQLASILSCEQAEVNSLHHQGIEQLAPSLNAAAFAPDHLVEAVELPGHPFGLGVQWHPEWLQAFEINQVLFQSFIQAAEKQAAEK